MASDATCRAAVATLDCGWAAVMDHVALVPVAEFCAVAAVREDHRAAPQTDPVAMDQLVAVAVRSIGTTIVVQRLAVPVVAETSATNPVCLELLDPVQTLLDVVKTPGKPNSDV